MALRVTQRQIYSDAINRMNYGLGALMESNLQAGTQKKINKPSDDPYGSAEILSHRAAISDIKQYQDNLSTAKGWLECADATLGNVHTNLTRLFTLAEQSATGTLNADQRTDISYEARQIFEQLMSQANTEFNGRQIFSGHKTSTQAFTASLGVTSEDAGLNGLKYIASGGANLTVPVRFTADGNVVDQPAFEYSLDGGQTWVAGTWDATNTPGDPKQKMIMGDVTLEIDATANPAAAVKAYDNTQTPVKTDNGTWLFVRPAAQYMGDDNDASVVQPYGAVLPAKASGVFTRDLAVRIDSVAGGVITYSYSLNDGRDWVQGTSPDNGVNTRLPVPGGFLDLTGGTAPPAGQQFIIRPHRANIDLDIGPYSDITLNVLGKDVFGGLYEPPFSTDGAQPVNGGGSTNLFEVVGRFVGALETNDQSGCQKALDEIKKVMVNVLNYRTEIGGRENRLTMAEEQLDTMLMDEETRLSYVEDVDITELMTKMSQQQLAYNAILKSSSMIMQMSLMNFL